jgi:hypothetical protein
MDDGHVDSRQMLSRDAAFIADAIREDWIMRGLKLGIGFWLAGVVIVVTTVLVLLALGALGGIAALTSRPASAGDVGATERQSDDGDWRQRLKSYDDYVGAHDPKTAKP